MRPFESNNVTAFSQTERVREKIRFIFNPCSGRRRRNASLLPVLRDFISNRGLDAELTVTEGPGHATLLAREAVQAGFGRVAAVGGDGTVNEIAQALRHTPTALAFVPCGSGNGLARYLGLPSGPAGGLELLASATGRVALIDIGSANGLPFFNAMGIGLDAEVSRRFNRLTRRGMPAYVRTALGAFLRHRRQSCVITGPSGRETLDVILVAAANSDQYGNGAFIAPGASIDDGLLDLVTLAPAGAVGALFLGARLFLGSLHRSSLVKRRLGARFVIERREPGIIHTDGETHPAAATVEIKAYPRSLRVLVPTNSRAHANAEGTGGFVMGWG
jgi:diacylglycerol kinase (ATP)